MSGLYPVVNAIIVACPHYTIKIIGRLVKGHSDDNGIACLKITVIAGKEIKSIRLIVVFKRFPLIIGKGVKSVTGFPGFCRVRYSDYTGDLILRGE